MDSLEAAVRKLHQFELSTANERAKRNELELRVAELKAKLARTARFEVPTRALEEARCEVKAAEAKRDEALALLKELEDSNAAAGVELQNVERKVKDENRRKLQHEREIVEVRTMCRNLLVESRELRKQRDLKRDATLRRLQNQLQQTSDDKEAVEMQVAAEIAAAADAAEAAAAERTAAELRLLAIEREREADRRAALESAVKACMADHIFSTLKGNINVANIEYLADINPCLHTGWVNKAFTRGCRKYNYDSILDAIQRKGVGVMFHGTTTGEAIASIFCEGLDPARRTRQVFGLGEYGDLDIRTSPAYAGGCGIIVLLYLNDAPRPPQSLGQAMWRVIDNPSRDTGVTYCLPIAALRQVTSAAKPVIPPCQRCRRR